MNCSCNRNILVHLAFKSKTPFKKISHTLTSSTGKQELDYIICRVLHIKNTKSHYNIQLGQIFASLQHGISEQAVKGRPLQTSKIKWK